MIAYYTNKLYIWHFSKMRKLNLVYFRPLRPLQSAKRSQHLPFWQKWHFGPPSAALTLTSRHCNTDLSLNIQNSRLVYPIFTLYYIMYLISHFTVQCTTYLDSYLTIRSTQDIVHWNIKVVFLVWSSILPRLPITSSFLWRPASY